MAFDERTDARRLGASLFGSALLLCLVFGLVASRALDPAWKRSAAGFGALSPGFVPSIHQELTCEGQIDRCTTCHLGIDRPDLGRPDVPAPFRPHPLAALHRGLGLGCSLCHGGTGRALSMAAAHALPAGDDLTSDPLMTRPFSQAACRRCHPPGAVPGTERLLQGAVLYTELGCPVCHPLTPGGRGGADFGPDLRSMGRVGLLSLETSLVEPAANFPGSTMPAFDRTFREHPEALVDLQIFLLSLPLPRPAGCAVRPLPVAVETPCSLCHAGERGEAAVRLEHRCAYILAHRTELRCAGCHQARPQGGECPVIREHRPACAACH